MHSAPILTLGDMIEANARKFPDEVAFVVDGRRPTHRQFAERARRLASAWQLRGLLPQHRVSVLAQNCLEFAEIYGAGELAGFITTTVNFRLAAPEMLFIITDSAPDVLVFEAQYAALVATLRPQLQVRHYVVIGGHLDWAEDYEAVMASGDPAGPGFRASEADIAYLIYTSGTTGRPKGCILGQREEVCAAQILGSDMRCSAADRILLMMPLFHIGAKILQLAQHWRGGTAIIHRSFDPALILRTIAEERVTITHMAPTMIQSVLECDAIGRHDLSSLEMIVYAAAPMPTPVLRRGLEVFGPVFQQQYGQTEGPGTTLLRHQHLPQGSEAERRRLGSVGQASPTVRLRVVDEQGRDCPVGTPGEVLIQSGAMTRGYWNNAAATIETLRGGWVHTGDIGRLDEQDFLYLVDRKKDMIISGGENIYSREVEEALVHHPAVSEAAVIGMPDAKWGETVCAVIVLRPGASVTGDELVEHCTSLIARYKRPRRVVFVDSIAKLPSGKVNKVELRRQHITAVPT